MDIEKFNRDMRIDPDALDVAAATQGELFWYWSEQYSSARIAVDAAKAKLDLTENKLSLNCRKDPDSFGLTKTTESAITSTVKTHIDYLIAVKRYLKNRKESLLLEHAVQAFEQRKRMIEMLITLHGQQYFAGPKIPRDFKTAFADFHNERLDKSLDRQRERVMKRKNKKRKNRK